MQHSRRLRVAAPLPAAAGSDRVDDGDTNRGHLDRRQLLAVLAVGEELHFGRAAQRLGVQQSALSQLIRRVEDQLGLLLFDRSSHHVYVTDEGEQILGVAREALAALGRVEDLAHEIAAGRSGTLRLGTTPGVSEQIYEILERFREHHGGVEVRMRVMDTRAKLRALLAGDLDVALLKTAHPVEGIDMLELWQERLVAMLSSGHPLAAREELSIAELAVHPVILASREHHPWARDHAEGLFASAGVAPLLGPPYRTLQESLATIARSQAWTIVSSAVARRESSASVVSLPLSDAGASVPVSLAWPCLAARSVVRALVHDVSALMREGAFRPVLAGRDQSPAHGSLERLGAR